nr:hypothetical protein [Candidatus Sigynarchaeota archaeon]
MPIKLADSMSMFNIMLCGPRGAGKKTLLSKAIENYVKRVDQDVMLAKTVVSTEGGSVFILAPRQGVGWWFHIVEFPFDGARETDTAFKFDGIVLIADREPDNLVENERCVHELERLYKETDIFTISRTALKNTPMLVCLNKSDLPSAVEEARFRSMLQPMHTLNPLFLHTVGFTNENVKQALKYIARECLVRHYSNQYPDEERLEPVSLQDLDEQGIRIVLHNGSNGEFSNPRVLRPRLETAPPQPARTTQGPIQGIPVEAFLVAPERIAFLKGILAKAVDVEELKKIMGAMGFERTIVVTNQDELAFYLGIRIQVIQNMAYILCPVHFLYDPGTGTETGFAIDVDQDHFSVYAYMFKPGRNEYRVLSSLPHCVHRAIALDAKTLEEVGNEKVEVANEASAIFFINSLIADLTSDVDSPAEFFDDKLYLQILNRLVTIKEPSWVNLTAITNKFDQLMKQLETLDKDDQLYANNKRRVFLNIVQFFFGIPDLVQSRGFLNHLNPRTLQKHERTIRKHLETKEFIDFIAFIMERWSTAIDVVVCLFHDSILAPSPSFLQDVSALLFDALKNDKIDVNDFLHEMHRCNIEPDPAQADYLFKSLVFAGNLESTKELACKVNMPPDGNIFVALCDDIVTQGERFTRFGSKRLIEILDYGRVMPDAATARELVATFLKREPFQDVVRLIDHLAVKMNEGYRLTLYKILARKDLSQQDNKDSLSSFIQWLTIENDNLGIVAAATGLVLDDDVSRAEGLCATMNIVPDHRMAKHFYQELFQKQFKPNHVDIIKKIVKWTGFGPEPEQVQRLYVALLRERNVAAISRVFRVTNIMPEFPDELLAQLSIDRNAFSNLQSHPVRRLFNGKRVLKIFLGGEGGVGACTFAHRFVSNRFVPDTKLCLSEIFVKEIAACGDEYVACLWRMGAQERFRFLQSIYVKGSAGAILFFDVTRFMTLYALEGSWLPIVRNEDPDMPIFLVGTKKDMASEEEVRQVMQAAEEFVTNHHLSGFYFASAKTGENVEFIMDLVVEAASMKKYS